jgi:hypothetical protein
MKPFGVPAASGPASNYLLLFAGMALDSVIGNGTGLYHT